MGGGFRVDRAMELTASTFYQLADKLLQTSGSFWLYKRRSTTLSNTTLCFDCMRSCVHKKIIKSVEVSVVSLIPLPFVPSSPSPVNKKS